MELQTPTTPPASDAHAAGAHAGDATRGSLIKLAAELAGRLIALVTSLAVARALGVSDFGTYLALSGIAVILAEAADLGVQATAPRFLVACEVRLRSLVRAKLVASGATASIALALTCYQPLLGILLLFFVLAGWSEFLGVALRARARRLAEALVILCLRASGLALVAIALRTGGGLMPVAFALAASTIPAIALGATLLARVRHDEGDDRAVFPLFRSTFPLAVNGVLTLTSLRLEVLVLKWLGTGYAAGLYGAAINVVQSLVLVPAAIVGGAMPALTREAIRGEGPVRGRTALTAALLAVPATIGLVVLAPSILRFLYQDAFVPGTSCLRIVAIALIPLFMSQILLQTLIAAGKGPWLPRLMGARVAFAFPIALILIPKAGAVGASLGFLTAESLLLVLAVRACRTARFPVPVFRPLGWAVLVSLPMAGVVVLASRYGLVAAIGLGVVTYAATLFLSAREAVLEVVRGARARTA